LLDGRVDIVIGTHKLIHGSIKYKNLGLIVIDEEHRFGVKQKESLKKMRTLPSSNCCLMWVCSLAL
jgi:transcription-repair coupling factor (superfamily II helicase)